MLAHNLLASTVVAALLAASALAQQEHAGHEHHAQPEDGTAPVISAVDETKELPDQRPQGPHGGALYQVGELQAEALVEPGGMRLFLYNQDGRSIDLRAARGLATLQVQGNAKRYRYDLFPELRKDQSAEALAVAVDLRRIAGQQVEIVFQLVGIPGAERRPATFTARPRAPMTEQQRIAAAIAAQKVCPVSGHPLGSMGDPIPVTVGEHTIYVCCAGCIDVVKADPEKYFSEEPELKVIPAREADAEAIARQKLCPVMDEPLGSMGTPLKVTGLERDVFLCCRGCLKFLQQEPEKYLAKLPPLPQAKPTVEKATEADAHFVTVQKLCPVMDEPLDAMGGPYRTVVEGRIVYICCPGCAKKVQANPEVYLAKLSKQGVTLPTAQ